MPVGIEMVAEYRSRVGELSGAYKPPCSGGKNHLYTVDVQAWQGDTVLAETSIEMGRYWLFEYLSLQKAVYAQV